MKISILCCSFTQLFLESLLRMKVSDIIYLGKCLELEIGFKHL